jgi:hypothetical protein
MYDESVDWTDWTWELMWLVALLEIIEFFLRSPRISMNVV